MTVLEILIEACEASERDAQRVAGQLDEWALEIDLEIELTSQPIGFAAVAEQMYRLAADLRADDRRRTAIELGRTALARSVTRTVLPAGPMPDCDG